MYHRKPTLVALHLASLEVIPLKGQTETSMASIEAPINDGCDSTL